MNLKQIIFAVIAIAVIGVVAAVIIGGQDNPGVEDNNDQGIEVPDASGDSIDTSTPVANETTCFDILPGINRDYEIIRITGNVNETIKLSAETIFGITADEYLWTQRFADMTTLQYMSNHIIPIIDPDNETTSVNATYPGVYRIELTADGATYEMEFKATKEGKPLQMGINFIDLYGETGGPEFNIYPDDPECFQAVLEHAFTGPLRVDAEWIGLISGGFYAQVDPPVIQDDDSYLSLSDEYFYGEIIDAAHSRGMKVMETFQDGPSVYFTAEQHAELTQMKQTAEWWDHWYDAWKTFLLRRCEMAERHGVEAVVLMQFAESSFNPQLFPEYADRWVDIINSVREVYSGEVGLSFINADERLTFSDELDFIQITLFGGLYTSRIGAIAEPSNPTMEELLAINEEIFEGIDYWWGNSTPIYAVITFDSTDAQFSTEDPEQRTPTDFNEQVLYYEAFYSTIEKSDWATGVFTERWDYWDEYRRSGEDFNVQYFDETNAASPRNKPAEDVVALWSQIFHSQ